MCGRYMVFDDAEIPELQVLLRHARSTGLPFATGEVFPSDPAMVVVQQDGAPLVTVMKWGYTGSSRLLINARAETAAEKPTFATDLALRRCVIPTTGFFESPLVSGRHLAAEPRGRTVHHSDHSRQRFHASLSPPHARAALPCGRPPLPCRGAICTKSAAPNTRAPALRERAIRAAAPPAPLFRPNTASCMGLCRFIQYFAIFGVFYLKNLA